MHTHEHSIVLNKVADIGMPVVIADVFDGISFITGFGCEKFVNQEV